MKKLKRTSVILVFSIILQCMCSVLFTFASFAAAESITVQMYNGNTQSSSNTISPNFKIYNNGSTSINLSNVTIRYYYTSDGITGQNYTCDYAGNSKNITSSTKGRIVSMSSQTSNANNYLEVYFTSSAGSISPGAYIEVKGRITNSNHSNYNQSNDYSFISTAKNYVESSKVTAYINGVLHSGTEPVAGATPTPSKTSIKLTYEAESGYTSKSNMIMSNEYCSNGKYVGNLGLGNTLTIKANIPETGIYTMTIYYRSVNDRNVKFAQSTGSATHTFKCPGNVNANIIGGISKEVYLVKGTCDLVFSNPTESAPDIDFISITKNLVANTDFELGTSTSPANWKPSSSTNCYWDTTGGIYGSKAVAVTSSTFNGNNYFESEEIELEPYKYYIAEVSVRTTELETIKHHGLEGADLSVLLKASRERNYYDEFSGMISKGIKNTNNGWETAIINFQAPYDGKVKFRLNIRYAIGTCWFDNFKLYPDDNMVKMEGEKVVFGYGRTDIIDSGITSENIDKYIKQFDKLVDDNINLTGLDFTKHFEKEKINILSRVNLPWVGEAGAKIFIWFSNDAVCSDLARFNTHNALSWALPHEIGHVFDRKEWNFDPEFWGSFKAFATLTRTKTNIFMGDNYIDGEKNPGLWKYFEGKDSDLFNNNEYSGDYIIGLLASRAGVSWSSYTKAFQYFISEKSIPSNGYGKFLLYMNKLDEYQNFKPGSMLSLFTKQQLDVIEYGLHKINHGMLVCEAESYASSDYTRKRNDECSGGLSVELFSKRNTIPFSVFATEEGKHLIKLSYSSYVDNDLNIVVENSNGSKTYSLKCKAHSKNKPRGEFITVDLKTGNNIIKVVNPEGNSIYIDCIEVLRRYEQ